MANLVLFYFLGEGGGGGGGGGGVTGSVQALKIKVAQNGLKHVLILWNF